MDYKNLPTPTLIDKCARRDPIAWAEFVKRYLPLIDFSIKKTLWAYCRDAKRGDDIKDIQQNIMAALWSQNRLNEVKNRGNIDYWLAIISRNATVNFLRAGHKEILIGEDAYFEQFTAKEIEKPEEEGPGEKIEASYSHLSLREKLMFNLYFQKKLRLRDISKIMDIPLGTVSSAITRMRKKLKK